MEHKPYQSLDNTRDLIHTYIYLEKSGKDLHSTNDPLNTKILKEKIYPRRLNPRDPKLHLNFEEAYALGAFISDLGHGELIPELKEPIIPQSKRVSHSVLERYVKICKERSCYEVRCLSIATALWVAGITPTEMAGLTTAVLDWDIPKDNFVDPVASCIVDNCGMGGDKLFTPNISTVALLSVANYNRIKTCKHGSPGNTDSAGSSDFISYAVRKVAKEEGNGLEERLNKLGVFDNHGFLIGPKSIVGHSNLIDRTGFGYIEAVDPRFKTIHTQTHFIGQISHINDLLGPTTLPINPCKVTKKIIGVNHLIKTNDIAEVYKILNEKKITNVQNGFFVRGGGMYDDLNLGMDEFTNLGQTELSTLNGSNIETTIIEPEEFGIKKFRPSVRPESKNGRLVVSGISPAPGSEEGPNGKRNISMQLLRDEIKGPQRDLILMNMSPILVLTENASDFKDGMELANQLLSEQNGYKVLKEFVHALDEVE